MKLRRIFTLMFVTAFLFLPPASVPADFTPFMSERQEKKIGADAHPKILQQFGGAYEDQKISAYIADIGRRMVANSAKPRGEYTITLLDTPMLNAFAVPGGYVYVTRGILTVANSESEVAAVIGHELGHVTARHAAKRQTTAVGTGLLGALLGAAVGSDIVSQLLNVGAQGYVASYSRDQERESDRLGIESLARAGYDPFAMADFLSAMERDQRLERTLWGQAEDPAQFDFFSTHPATPKRIVEAHAMAAQMPGGRSAPSESYLRAIDGMIYGSSAEEGYVRGRVFAHPHMRITFTVPPAFLLKNTSEAVLAGGPDGAAIKFDAGRAQRSRHVEDYLTREWAGQVRLENVDRFSVDGMPAATGTLRQSNMDFRLVAIDAGEHIYRFLMQTPPALTRRLDPSLLEMVRSFRQLSAQEAHALKPLRVRVKRAARGQDVAFFARQMDFEDYREERFRALNGIAPGERLIPGRLVKIVSE